MKTGFRAICAVLVWTCIFGQYVVLVRSGVFGGFGASTLTYLGYFTITTNILVALAFTAPVLGTKNKLRIFFDRPGVRAAIALYIFVVAVVYYAVLAKDHKPEGVSAIYNMGLHLIMPVLYIFDWLFLAKKDGLSFKSAPLWAIYPIVYGLFNLGRGYFTGFYPYPFLDVTKHGIGGVTLTMLGFAAFYIAGGLLVIALGKLLLRFASQNPS